MFQAKSTKSADTTKRNDDAGKKSESQRSSKYSSSSSSSQHRSLHSSSSSKDRSRPSSRTSSSNHQHSDSKLSDRDKKRDSGDSSKSVRPQNKNESAQNKRDDSDKSRKSSDGKSPKKGEKSNGSNNDDHSAYREKPIDRRRSTDRDSNDGQSNPGSSSSINRAVDSASVGSTLSSKNSANTSPSMSADASKQPTNETNAKTDDAKVIADEMPSIHDVNHPMFLQPNSTESEEDFLLPTLPIVVDQILTGNEINLELLIGQNNIDPVLTTIQQSLVSSVLKKPKVASNFYEAKRLMKVRKQMERDEKKRIEQAMVLVKQYISNNSVMANNYGISDQGVELEFACITSDDSPAPSISSPIKSISPTINMTTPVTTVSAESVPSELPADDFYGFTEEDLIENAIDHKRKLEEFTNSSTYHENVMYLMKPDDMVESAIKKFAHNEVWILDGNSKKLFTQPQQPSGPNQKTEPEHSNTIGIVEFMPDNVTEAKTIKDEICLSESNRGVQLLFMENNKFDMTVQQPAAASSKPIRKRKQANKKVSTVTTADNYSPMVKQIKIDATIQMKTCQDRGESSQISTAIDDKQTTSIGQPNTSPTPSDQSVGSKENNFVPKIKKAVSRSMAHNMSSSNYVTCK